MSEREPITTELRDAMGTDHIFCDVGGLTFARNLTITQAEFDRLCDAIDAVHAGLERENAELRERLAVLDERDDTMHDGWVRLPVDKDGSPFHIGELVDEMLPFGGYAAPAPIDTMELYRGASGYGWMVKLGAESMASISPSLLRHYHAPTVEDVLREFADEMNQNLGMYTGEAIDADEWRDADAKTIAEYAAKLRLKGDAE